MSKRRQELSLKIRELLLGDQGGIYTKRSNARSSSLGPQQTG